MGRSKYSFSVHKSLTLLLTLILLYPKGTRVELIQMDDPYSRVKPGDKGTVLSVDVIVHKVDRLARNRGDDIDIMRILRECGVQLVSDSESIDDTPAGMLFHGIMSSIAEFYSQNFRLVTSISGGQMIKGVKNGRSYWTRNAPL